jgi:hypothetical protein
VVPNGSAVAVVAIHAPSEVSGVHPPGFTSPQSDLIAGAVTMAVVCAALCICFVCARCGGKRGKYSNV